MTTETFYHYDDVKYAPNVDEYNPAEKGTGAHNALADAEFQVRHLWKIVNRNKKAPA